MEPVTFSYETSASTGRSKIQIVEDELIVATDLKDSLSSMGYNVTCIASTGKDAVESARKDHPNLVLMDIRLKGKMDGIEAADIIRKELNIPVVYLTANRDMSMLEKAKRTEPFGFLVKPFDSHELMSTIETAIYRHKMEMRLQESEQRFRSLVENAADAFYVCDEAGRLVDANEAACQALGYKLEELLSLKISDFNLDMNRERISMFLAQTRTQDEPITLKGRHLKQNGESFPIEVRITSFTSEGKPLLLALARDTSEHEGLISELRDAVRRVNTLKSIVPLCVLRKNLSKAEEIEEGIHAHHDAVMNNGVCNECLSAFKNDLIRSKKPYLSSSDVSQSPSEQAQPQASPRALPKDSRPSR